MSIDLGLTAASSGLASINRQLSVVSQNVANAGTPGYSREVVATSNLTAGGDGYGVRTGVATRETNAALQTALYQQNADVAGQQVTSDALASVDAAQGTTAAGNDLASRLGELTDAFTTLGTTRPTRRSKPPWSPPPPRWPGASATRRRPTMPPARTRRMGW